MAEAAAPARHLCEPAAGAWYSEVHSHWKAPRIGVAGTTKPLPSAVLGCSRTRHHSATSTIPSGAYHTLRREHPARTSAGTGAREIPARPRPQSRGPLPTARMRMCVRVAGRPWAFLSRVAFGSCKF